MKKILFLILFLMPSTVFADWAVERPNGSVSIVISAQGHTIQETLDAWEAATKTSIETI